jgi:hypothetical protein
VFTSFLHYYKLNTANKWEVDGKNWTYTAEVTEFSPFGEELESRDALGRYSSAVFGYNQKMPLAVAANSRYRSMAFDNFEDYDFSKCADNHFKFKQSPMLPPIIDNQSHTGRKSIKVTSTAPVSLQKQLTSCNIVECDLDIQFYPFGPTPNTQYVNILNGTPPYAINYTVLNGNPIINLQANGTQLYVNSQGAYYELEVIVTDAKGCKQVEKIVWTPTKN